MTARNRNSLKSDLENGDTFDQTIAGDIVDSFLSLDDSAAQTVSSQVTFNSKTTHSGGIDVTSVSAASINAAAVYSQAFQNTVDVSAVAVGSAQATGYAISAAYTIFTGVSAGQEAALLPNVYGRQFFVYNDTAANLKVFPYSGGKIDALSANAAYVVSAALGRAFRTFNATRIVSS